MKRVRCPKCDHYIIFDETKYEEGQSLVFICDECKKQFSIRIGASKLNAIRKEECLTLARNARETMGGLFAANPCEMSHEDCVGIFEKAYK